MSQAEVKNEIKYRMAVAFLRKLLGQGLINDAEFEIADRYNAEKYKPFCKSI